MRAMWIAAGFGLPAIGMALGVLVSGPTPGAEAAPPSTGGGTTGRPLELGTVGGKDISAEGTFTDLTGGRREGKLTASCNSWFEA